MEDKLNEATKKNLLENDDNNNISNKLEIKENIDSKEKSKQKAINITNLTETDKKNINDENLVPISVNNDDFLEMIKLLTKMYFILFMQFFFIFLYVTIFAYIDFYKGEYNKITKIKILFVLIGISFIYLYYFLAYYKNKIFKKLINKFLFILLTIGFATIISFSILLFSYTNISYIILSVTNCAFGLYLYLANIENFNKKYGFFYIFIVEAGLFFFAYIFKIVNIENNIICSLISFMIGIYLVFHGSYIINEFNFTFPKKEPIYAVLSLYGKKFNSFSSYGVINTD